MRKYGCKFFMSRAILIQVSAVGILDCFIPCLLNGLLSGRQMLAEDVRIPGQRQRTLLLRAQQEAQASC